jgi:hypothetical protein
MPTEDCNSSTPQENIWSNLKTQYRQVGDNIVGMIFNGYKALMSKYTWTEIEVKKK